MRLLRVSIFSLLLAVFSNASAASLINPAAIFAMLEPLLIKAGLLASAVVGGRLAIIAIIFGFKLIRKDYRPMPLWLINDKKAWSDYRKRHK